MEKIQTLCLECAEREETHHLAWIQDLPVQGLRGWCNCCQQCAARIMTGPATEKFKRHSFLLLPLP